MGWHSNPAKTQGTWFQDLMKLRFLTSHHRKNSVRDKVIGKERIYQIQTEARSTECGPSRASAALKFGRVSFIGGAISYANEWEDYSNYLGEGVEISRIWVIAHSFVFFFFSQCTFYFLFFYFQFLKNNLFILFFSFIFFN